MNGRLAWIGTALLLGWPAGSALAQDTAELDCAPQVIRPTDNLAVYRGEPFERAIMLRGYRQQWKRIQWRKDLAAALEDGRRLQKPVAVVMMLDEYSQGTAGFS